MAGHVWRFGDCEFDELRRELRVRGNIASVEAKPLDLLRQLLLHAGEVVTKEELLEAVWPGLMVVDGSLATAVSKLRKAMGDERIIVTLPRVGYRLGVPVFTNAEPPQDWSDLHLIEGGPVPGRAQWRLTRRLDLSPSSEVWLAEHPKTHERRVFKFAPDHERLRGLKREVTLARLLRESLGERPEFVRILEWNFDIPPYFIESEYAGRDLAEWSEQQGGLASIPLNLRLRLLVDAARAVAIAHDLGVLHKDLKPGNILIDDSDVAPRVRIADFGSASLLAPARLKELGITNLGFTQSGSVNTALTGTVLYMAPELVSGQSPSPASDVYALGVLLYQLMVGDFRRPLAPGWEADVPDPVLRQDIADMACGDPARRLDSAAAVVARLVDLDRRRAEIEEAEKSRRRAEAFERRRAEWHARRPVLVVAAVALAIAAGLSLRSYHNNGVTPAASRVKTIAVQPFDNTAGDPAIDYLRIALPDEAATILSQLRGVAVRPLVGTTDDRTGTAFNGRARQQKADVLVTGRFLKTDHLRITVEAVDAGATRIIWRDTIDVPATSLVSAQIRLALGLRQGLASALGVTSTGQPARPSNEEAYDLFLRSAALPFDPASNAQARQLLERSVELDPTYLPASLVLARRYYVESRYGSGDPEMMKKWDRAVEHALALDPGNVGVAAGYLRLVIERGQVAEAYRRALELLQNAPGSVDAHFTVSYALRFAGLLEESARHCETALTLDARTVTSGLRSCAIVFLQAGDYPRALNFIQLEDSGYTKALSIDMLVRQHRDAEALAIGSPDLPRWPSYDLLLACVAHRPANEIRELAQRVEPVDDPEANYLFAAHLAYCGDTDAAIAMLRRAIDGNYCSYPAIESDPLFAPVRERSQYAALRESARACQRAFVEALPAASATH